MLDSKPLLISERGRPVAALIPLEELDWEVMSLSSNPICRKLPVPPMR